MAALVAAMVAPAFAEDAQTNPPAPAGDIMADLTNEQRECVMSKDCPAMDAQMDDSARECIRAAFADCGLEMPTAPVTADETAPDEK